MRLFAGFTLLALGLFWSYPFLAPEVERAVRSRAAPAPARLAPVLVAAPTNIRVQPGDTAAAAVTGSSADPHR